MAHDSIIAQTARAVEQYDYKDFVIDGSKAEDGSKLLTLIQSQGPKSATFNGKGLTWYIRQSGRAATGYANNSTFDYSTIGGLTENGVQLTAAMDEIFHRADIPGSELRRQEAEGDVASFVNSYVQLQQDLISSRNQVIPSLILRDGTGKLGTATSSGTVTITPGSTGAVNVDDVNAFSKGMIVDAVDTSGNVDGTRGVITKISSNYGAGTLTIRNDNASNFVVDTGASFYVINSASSGRMHGFDYLISDGDTTGETGYATYPRNISGGSNVTVTRTDPEYAQSLQSIVRNAGKAIDFDLLDDMHQRIIQEGRTPEVMKDELGNKMGYTYYTILRPEHFVALQKIARAHDRDFGFGEIEDMGLKRPVFNNFPFITHKLVPKNKIFFPYIPDFAAEFTDPVTTSSSDYGIFQKKYGNDLYEHVKSERCQMIALSARNSGKITNVTGEATS